MFNIMQKIPILQCKVIYIILLQVYIKYGLFLPQQKSLLKIRYHNLIVREVLMQHICSKSNRAAV